MSQAVRCEIGDDRVARLTLDDPTNRANTLNRAMWEQLGDACRELAQQPQLRGMIIQSAKPDIFIAGADLREIAELPVDDPEPTRALVRRGRDVLAALESLPFPTIAAIDGAALGGGFEVALACDFRIAGSNPKIKVGLPEVKLGLIPGWGGTQRPGRIIGFDAAARLVCTGEVSNAAVAHDLGLIDIVSESGKIDDIAVGTLIIEERKPTGPNRRRLKRSPVKVLSDLGSLLPLIARLTDDQRPAGEEALRVTRNGASLPLDNALAIEEAAFIPLVASTAARRLIAAFLHR